MEKKYPKKITLELLVQDDGKVEILNAPEKCGITDFKHSNPLRGHNVIGVLVSNPTCFIVGGVMYCY